MYILYMYIFKIFKTNELLGLTVIYSVYVGSSSRLLGPSNQLLGLFLNRNWHDGPNKYVCLDMYIYIYTFFL